VPLLLKSLGARGRILIKSLALLSKSKRFYGLGAGTTDYSITIKVETLVAIKKLSMG